MSASSPTRIKRRVLVDPTSYQARVAQAVSLARSLKANAANVEDRGDERDNLERFIPAVFKDDRGRPAVPPRHIREQFIPALTSPGNVVIIAPPGSAKTNSVIGWLSWLLGNNPREHVAYFSSTEAIAASRSIAVRDTIATSPAYGAIFPEVAPDRRKGWTQDQWFLQRADPSDKDATFRSAGAGSSITGWRAGIFVYDDIANAENQATPYQRAKLIDWIEKEVLARSTPSARHVMITTRWHKDDPAAWAIRQGWRVVHIPAIDDRGVTYWPSFWRQEMISCPGGRHGYAVKYRRNEQGEVLCWENRDAAGRVTEEGRCKRLQLGARTFGLQYLGEPSDDDAAKFKREWWQLYRVLPGPIATYLQYPLDPDEYLEAPLDDVDTSRWRLNGAIFVDTAHEEKKSADYTVIAVWVAWGPFYYLVDLWRSQAAFRTVKATLKAMRLKYDLPVFIEKTVGASGLISELRHEIDRVHPWPIKGLSKLARVERILDVVEAGNCYLPSWAPWLIDFIEEHVGFENGAPHDDMVDTTTMALLRLAKRRSLSVV